MRIENSLSPLYRGTDFSTLAETFKTVCGGGKFVLLGVASPWNTRKGLEDFCRLRRMLSLYEFAIILVGLKPEQIDRLPDGIISITRINSEQELSEYYSMADVFVNLTYLDTFPTVNLEALACGTPVLTYRTGGSPESVDEKTGIVVAQGDVKGVVNAITSMKMNPLSAESCRKRAEDNFDKDKCYEAYIQLYDDLIKDDRYKYSL